MNRKLVAIHQPNFFPWLGYFNKLYRADTFIFMDNVQYPETSRGSWINRVKLIVQGTPKWVTIPIVRSYSGFKTINEIEIDDSRQWRNKFMGTVRANYSRAPFFKEVILLIEPLVMFETALVAEFNIYAITVISGALGIDVSKLIRGTSLGTSGSATDLLITMTLAVGGSAYLCGGGAAGYQKDSLFAENEVALVYQNFQHPEYRQCGCHDFIPGQSIIDVLMNCGISATKELISAKEG